MIIPGTGLPDSMGQTDEHTKLNQFIGAMFEAMREMGRESAVCELFNSSFNEDGKYEILVVIQKRDPKEVR